MRIGIPVVNGRLSPHFGHAEQFLFVDVDADGKTILRTSTEVAPEHVPGLLPRWLQERQVNVVIAGTMGSRAQSLFRETSIEVLTGAPSEDAEVLARNYLNGVLVTEPATCDHHRQACDH